MGHGGEFWQNMAHWRRECQATSVFWSWEPHAVAAAAAKLFQSCLTLCNQMDHSLPGSSIHGIVQARVLAWAAIAFSREPYEQHEKQKGMTLKDEFPRSVGAQYAMRDQWRNNSRKNERWSQSKNNTHLWMWLMMEVKSDTFKSNIA